MEVLAADERTETKKLAVVEEDDAVDVRGADGVLDAAACTVVSRRRAPVKNKEGAHPKMKDTFILVSHGMVYRTSPSSTTRTAPGTLPYTWSTYQFGARTARTWPVSTTHTHTTKITMSYSFIMEKCKPPCSLTQLSNG